MVRGRADGQPAREYLLQREQHSARCRPHWHPCFNRPVKTWMPMRPTPCAMLFTLKQILACRLPICTSTDHSATCNEDLGVVVAHPGHTHPHPCPCPCPCP